MLKKLNIINLKRTQDKNQRTRAVGIVNTDYNAKQNGISQINQHGNITSPALEQADAELYLQETQKLILPGQ